MATTKKRYYAGLSDHNRFPDIRWIHSEQGKEINVNISIGAEQAILVAGKAALLTPGDHVQLNMGIVSTASDRLTLRSTASRPVRCD